MFKQYKRWNLLDTKNSNVLDKYSEENEFSVRSK